jgi:hypothetical protein
MPRVDHDHRQPSIYSRAIWILRSVARKALRAVVFGGLCEGLGGCRNEIDDEAGRLGVYRIEHKRVHHLDRPREIEHDPRPARSDQTIAVVADQPAPFARLGRRGKLHVRKVDHQAVRVREP